MAKKKKKTRRKTATMLFKERLQSRKLWLAFVILVIGMGFHLKGMLDKELVGLLCLIYVSYAASNVSSKYTYMKYG